MNIIDPVIDLSSEEANTEYPVSYCVSYELLCINWNDSQVTTYIIQAGFKCQGLSTSWWMQTEIVWVSTTSE